MRYCEATAAPSQRWLLFMGTQVRAPSRLQRFNGLQRKRLQKGIESAVCEPKSS